MYPLVRELADDGVPVVVSCRVLGLARQPYYRWLEQPITDDQLDAAVEVAAALAVGGARDGAEPFARVADRCGRRAVVVCFGLREGRIAVGLRGLVFVGGAIVVAVGVEGVEDPIAVGVDRGKSAAARRRQLHVVVEAVSVGILLKFARTQALFRPVGDAIAVGVFLIGVGLHDTVVADVTDPVAVGILLVGV